jgi:hypothetical protein
MFLNENIKRINDLKLQKERIEQSVLEDDEER